MSLNASRSRMAALTRELAGHWRETRESWVDSRRDEFERQYMNELFASVDRALTAIEQLEEVLKKVRKDCE